MNTTHEPGRNRTYNPYASPAAMPVITSAAATSQKSRSRKWAIAYAISGTSGALCLILNVLGIKVALSFGLLATSLSPAFGMLWLAAAWKSLPIFRQTIRGTGVSLGSLVFRMFIPFYNIFWIFAAPRALADALVAESTEAGAMVESARPIATAAVIAHLVSQFTVQISASSVMILVAFAPCAALWGWFIVRIEKQMTVLRGAHSPSPNLNSSRSCAA